ncbi:SoxR reducing system RseC family protein [Fenollaria sporofastidiosus]|uniref:SoxR reducing system RseC family protein n=1 Tax=Fenollaria sporofastidiosus TaxID=2811778 RepID=UPI001C006CDE|nr:SoxR reducing system RseC family protein [Fenollaria sporofastidiosus]
MEENESIGRVIKIENGQMLISMKRDSACGSCESCAAGCESKEHIIKAKPRANYNVGDLVSIKVDSRKMLRGVMMVYLVPLLAFLLGIFVSNYIFSKLSFKVQDFYSIIIGVVLLLISLVIVKAYDKKYSKGDNDLLIINKLN